MLGRTTIILPAADSQWEVWRCGPGSVWQSAAEDPIKGAQNSRAVVMALPARSCRTFAFSAPTEDPQVARKLSFAQLEKRGLTNVNAEQTPFDCHLVKCGNGHSIVSVDVVTPEAAASLVGSKACAALPSARLYPMPFEKLVIMEEHGRLVLCASADGRVLHSQIVSATRDLNGHAAPEIHIAKLALQQQGIVEEIRGVELWGNFSESDASELSQQLALPVVAKARPAPDSAAVRREGSTRLLPAAARLASRRRQLGVLRWAAALLLLLPLGWWMIAKHRELAAAEAEAARIEGMLNLPSDGQSGAFDQERLRAEHEFVTAAQTRWLALKLALEPRRYPMAHLNALTRCLSAADVVLTRFETKLVDISISGTGRSAMDAYNYFNAVSKDAPLGVYAWSMAQPIIGTDGSATFELKGKMR